MRDRIKQLGKDSFIYGIGGIIAKAIGFFLLPVYTRIFTPADYGQIEMLLILNSFLGSILTMGMDSAQSFYFFEQKEEGKPAQARVITGILQWRLSWGVVIVIVSMLLSPVLNAQFFNGELSWYYFVFAFVGAFFGQLYGQSAEIFRLLFRPGFYMLVTLGAAVLSIVIALILVLVFHMGIVSFFVALMISSIVASVFGWWSAREYLDWSTWHRAWWPRLMRFGLPLVPASLAMYILNSSDRWFINFYCGQDALGLYAVGAKFAMLISLAVTSFRSAWWPIALDAIHSSDGQNLFRMMGRAYMGGAVVLIVLLTAISPWLIRFLTGPKFHSAYPIIGVLAWYSSFYGFYLILAAGIWKREKTAWVPIGMAVAAVMNIALDAWLVPLYGSIGAAIATSFSFFIWNLITLIIAEKLWPVKYPYSVLGFQIALGVTTTVVILLLYQFEQPLWNVILVTIISIPILLRLSISRGHLKALYRYRINLLPQKT